MASEGSPPGTSETSSDGVGTEAEPAAELHEPTPTADEIDPEPEPAEQEPTAAGLDLDPDLDLDRDPDPDIDPEPPRVPVDEDPIPDQLFTVVDESVGAVDEPTVVDVTDGAGTDDDATRTAARMVADVLAARVTPAPATDTVTTASDDVAVADEDVWSALDDADDAWSAVVPVAADESMNDETQQIDADGWSQASRPRRTGRWLITTVLGAVALAYLFPLAVRAVRDLVALS